MAKVGEVRCFEAGSIMMARCLALMQYHWRTAEEKVGLCDRLTGLKQKVEQLAKTKESLEQEVLDLWKVNADKDSALAKKETQLLHLQGLCEWREAELTQAERIAKEVESRMVEL